ncbi:hypothetical protein BCR39DRAFT_545340 [Naematelia encephala]|uniref:BTB domain-containing protein n=1 Tax=Naematelia encephala TaxID=71784 RepID=A0A1Y2ASN1_9TREE|nr:hypothetical protein BCR39DRAFT_545340 [Naematelia encephala]
MPNLHVHFLNGNIKAFRQELDGTGGPNTGAGGGVGGGGWKGPGSASGGKSWTLSGMSGMPTKADPNERDAFGRTVLHLAAGILTQNAYTFFSILLRNPNISVNLQDYESGYTALHRALFAGNIKAARDLLARNDIDPSIKDAEGLTAFDLYNGTVDGTNPPQDAEGTDLFVWGVNRNFALGIGDSSDKAYPDHVNLLTQNQASGKPDPTQRFRHVGVKDVVMAKFHTGVVTTDARGNLSLCGFGSNGRLGRTVHSQLALTPMPDLPHNIVSIALGQDHSLALTSGGYILSWGFNRFSQLGYVIDPSEKPIVIGKDDDMVQVSPRRIVGPLKKEWVRGVAAGRMSSACWTADALWTWGTNAGHLGYEKAANPVQVLPRKVTGISQPVLDVALSDFAMICLLDTYEVVCFHHDTNFRITFSTPRILADAFPFRPPQSTLKPMIRKVTSCGNTFAALSSIGDVFTFTLPNPAEDVSKEAKDRHVTVKPQLVWALRKRFTAVKDIALGSDGTVIICTQSGHVFVRQRVKSGSGQLKFRHIPYLQRVIKVAVNESGAFAAIRVDAKPTPIALVGRTLEEDMMSLQPHIRRFENQMTAEDFEEKGKVKVEEDEEDEGANSVTKDLAIATTLCTILRRWRANDVDSLFSWSESLLGSDLTLHIGEYDIPAHSTVLCLRSAPFARLLSGDKLNRFTLDQQADATSVAVDVCHPLAILLLLQYIYSDDIAAIWDARVARVLQDKYADLSISIGQIKSDLASLAEILELHPLSGALKSAGKLPIGRHTLAQDLQAFFNSTSVLSSSPACDVKLVLADKEVACSSVLLRARCPFFEAMFADPDWVSARAGQGAVVIRMEHLKWRPMRLVFRFIHEGVEDDLFDYLHQETLDEFLDFVFEVLAAATELLLDRLVLVCSRAIIRHCNAFNAAALSCEASFYQAGTLKRSIFDYIIASMETMLESGLLDDMEDDVLLELCKSIEEKQTAKLSVARSGLLVNQALEKHREWLAIQDIPVPRVRQPFRWKPRSPLLSPSEPLTGRKENRRGTPSPVNSPDLPAAMTPVDDIFTMDDDLSSPPTSSSRSHTPHASRPMTPLDLSANAQGSRGGPVWRSKAIESDRVDLRSIMAETAANAKTPSRPGASTAQRTPSSLEKRVPGSAFPTPSKSVQSLPNRTPSSSATTGPWRASESSQRASFTALQAQQATSPPSAAVLARSATSQASPVPHRTGSSKVITPIKLQQPASSQRKTSIQGPAWNSAAGFAPGPSVVAASPDSRSFSLLAIQQQERDFADQTKKPTRSFAEIQEEERRVISEKAQEEEFMRWWQEEEARVAKDPDSGTSSGRGGRGGRGGDKRKVPNRGRGRGGAAGTANGRESKVEPSSVENRGSTGRSRAGGGRGGGRGGRGGAVQERLRVEAPVFMPSVPGSGRS